MIEPTTAEERAEWASYYEFYNRGSKREGSRVRRLIDQVEALIAKLEQAKDAFKEIVGTRDCQYAQQIAATFLEEKP